MTTYDLEDIRDFLIKRTWLCGDEIGPWKRGSFRGYHLVTDAEYENLKARLPSGLSKSRINHIRSFIEGWMARS